MSKTKATAMALVTAIAVAALAYGTTAATASKPQTTTFTYSVRYSPFFQLDLGKKGQTLGDELIAHDLLYTKGGRKIGQDVMACTLASTAPPEASCNLTFVFADGTITGQSMDTPPPHKIIAITGGTGKYLGARGRIELFESGQDNRGNTATFTLLH
jgi:hypothetical protein